MSVLKQRKQNVPKGYSTKQRSVTSTSAWKLDLGTLDTTYLSAARMINGWNKPHEVLYPLSLAIFSSRRYERWDFTKCKSLNYSKDQLN